MCTKRKNIVYLLFKEMVFPSLCLRTVYKKTKDTVRWFRQTESPVLCVLWGARRAWWSLLSSFSFYTEVTSGVQHPWTCSRPTVESYPEEDTGMSELNLYQWNNISYLGIHLQRLIFFPIFLPYNINKNTMYNDGSWIKLASHTTVTRGIGTIFIGYILQQHKCI